MAPRLRYVKCSERVVRKMGQCCRLIRDAVVGRNDERLPSRRISQGQGQAECGDTGDGPWFGDLQKKQVDISAMRETLIFGQAFQGGPTADPDAAVAALPDDAEICGCNGVCKGRITSTIQDKGLTTLEAVRSHTKASASCGSCTGLVEKLMRITLGAAWQPSAVTPICGCTELGHDDVRRLIKAKELKTIPDVMQALEWKSSCGCAKCR